MYSMRQKVHPSNFTAKFYMCTYGKISTISRTRR